MSDKSKIEWCDATWNVVRGCSRVSTGCERCYAEGVAARFSGPGQPYEGLALRKASGPAWTGEVRFVPEHLSDPLRWKRPRMVFVNSMSDLFHEKVTNEQIAAIFGVMAASPRHTFQVLTKRPKRMLEWFKWVTEEATDEGSGRFVYQAEACRSRALDLAPNNKTPDGAWSKSLHPLLGYDQRWPLPNVWLGVSAENQKAANERVPLLLQTPAAVRFVSAEPLLGPIDFNDLKDGHTYWARPAEIEERALDWVIVGGESGPNARGCDVAWIRSIVEQCKEAGTACFTKQLGASPVDKLSNDSVWDHERIERDWPGKSISSRLPNYDGNKVFLNDRKGGDMSEWPEDLRVRQFPHEGKMT